MQVSCPNCYATYDLAPEKLPEAGIKPTCKKCGIAFTIVKASGDPLKDRAKRMQGIVVLHGEKKEFSSHDGERTAATGVQGKSPLNKALFQKKGFKVGLCIAGMALLFLLAGFYQWKHSVHEQFERALRNSLAHVSTDGVALKFQDMSFSFLGGLTRYHGRIHGLSLTDQEGRTSLKLVDQVDFELDLTRKRFITQPFNVRMNVQNTKLALNGCVMEVEENNGFSMKFRVNDSSLATGRFDSLVIRGLEVSFHFRGGDWKEDPRFSLGDADLSFKVSDVEASNRRVSKDVDILIAVKNGLFPREQYAAESSRANYFEILRTKLGDSETVATVERCSLDVLGSSVNMAGKVRFHNPVTESEADMRLTAMDFSHIMKFIHSTDRESFDKIVSAIVALDEKNISVYSQGDDSLRVNLSYRDSKAKINDRDLKSLI
jgi:predicted Zn finger-like uncharacterized protein